MANTDEGQKAERTESLEDISSTNSMPETPKLPETTYHPSLKPYKSTEERIFVDSGIRNYLAYGGKALYATAISLFRIPTLARKCYNHQTWCHKDKEINTKKPTKQSILFGVLTGGAFGFMGDIGYFAYSIDQCGKGDYLPLAFLGATNLASGIFELGRLSRSKQERLEVKAQIEAERAKGKGEF